MLARGIRQFVVLLFIAAIPAVLLAGWQAKRARHDSLSEGEIWPAAAGRFPIGSILFVDARSREEYARGHAPGAVLLNSKEWNSLIAGFYDAWEPGKTIIVYGRARSDEPATVAHLLRSEARLENVFVLKGIWEEWPRN